MFYLRSMSPMTMTACVLSLDDEDQDACEGNMGTIFFQAPTADPAMLTMWSSVSDITSDDAWGARTFHFSSSLLLSSQLFHVFHFCQVKHHVYQLSDHIHVNWHCLIHFIDDKMQSTHTVTESSHIFQNNSLIDEGPCFSSVISAIFF